MALDQGLAADGGPDRVGPDRVGPGPVRDLVVDGGLGPDLIGPGPDLELMQVRN